MKRTILFFILGVWLTCAEKAGAAPDYQSGNFFLPHCQHYLLDNYRFDVWDGDCGGSIDTLLFLGKALPEGFRVCKPNGVTSAQAVRIVVNFMQMNPQQLHEPFRILAMTALSQAWPCK